MRFLILVFILSSFNTFSFAQNEAENESVDARGFIPRDKKLFIKKIDSKRKHRIKNGAMIQFSLKSDTTFNIAQLVHFNEKGMYLSPYELRQDSSNDLVHGLIIDYQLIYDTVHFVNYNEFIQFNYRNNLGSKLGDNYLLAGAGLTAIFTATLLSLVNEKNLSDLRDPESYYTIGAGIIFSIVGILNFKKLKSFKNYSLEKHEFYFKYIY